MFFVQCFPLPKRFWFVECLVICQYLVPKVPAIWSDFFLMLHDDHARLSQEGMGHKASVHLTLKFVWPKV